MVTLKDIAAQAGVSMMTVSRVMNGNSGKVSEKTADKIRTIAKDMGYIPNSSARSLAARSSRIIAVVFRDVPDYNPLGDPYSSTFLGLILKEIQKRGYYVMVHFAQDFSDITFRLRSWNAEGAIFLGLFDEEVQQIQNGNQIPLVFTDSYSQARQIMNVGIDDYKGGALAAAHFLQKGHKNLGFAGYFTKLGGVVSQRCQGFFDTLEKNGGHMAREHVFDLEKITMDGIADSLLSDSNPPSGIFVSSDAFALDLYGKIFQRGLRVPEHLSLIGFDDFPISSVAPFSLTTIHQDIEKKASETCRILFEHIEKPDKPSESVTLDVRLVERDSVSEQK